MAFSISVILGTIGIMDGFKETLKRGLKKSSADIIVSARDSFFKYGQEMKNIFSSLNIGNVCPALKTQGLLTSKEMAKGVEIYGVDVQGFNKTTGLTLHLSSQEIAIGSVLALQLGLKIGDTLSLALPSGNESFAGLPFHKEFKVGGIIDHGLYEKNLRLVYIHLSELQSLINVGDKINILLLGHKKSEIENLIGAVESKRIMGLKSVLARELGPSFYVRPYWSEFGTLLEVVDIEKRVIGLILQMVVLISIFNVLAFVIFIKEKKAKELFLYRALGMAQKTLAMTSSACIFLLWACACVLAIFFVKGFNYALMNFSLFQLPGDIYHLGRLSISLSYSDYLLVFSLTLLWLFVVSVPAIMRLNRPLIANLRREFS